MLDEIEIWRNERMLERGRMEFADLDSSVQYLRALRVWGPWSKHVVRFQDP